MSVSAAIHSVASVGIFPSRAFVPAFLTSVLLRWGHQIPILSHSEFVQSLSLAGKGTTWFTHDITMVVLGLLAAAEIWATKDADVRQMMQGLDRYLKAAMAVVTLLGLQSVVDVETVQAIQQAGFASTALALAIGAGVFALAGLRNALMEFLDDADPDDSTGLMKLLSWAEDAWVLVALIILVAYPVFVLAVSALLVLLTALLRKLLERREEKRKIACASCGEMIYRTAVTCPKCRTGNPHVEAVGFLGSVKLGRAADMAVHRYRLVEWLRCPVCATRLRPRLPRQTCAACGHRVMEDRDFEAGYVAYVQQRLVRVLPICFGISLVPMLGAMVGIVYYRFRVVMPYLHYLPRWRSIAARWLLKLFYLLLLVLQLVPLVGGLMVPLMALTSHGVYRRALRRVLADPKYDLAIEGNSQAGPRVSD
ncbi:MAG: hypothetical protein GXY74_03145 [Phycisphaerae bacterium]|nr:hypothetical protein [Phycisphaerae bacterium]